MKGLLVVTFLLSLIFNVSAYAELQWEEVGKAVTNQYKNDAKAKREISRMENRGLIDDGIEYIWTGGECYEDECIYQFLIVHMFSSDDESYLNESIMARVYYSDTGTMYDVEIVQLAVLNMATVTRSHKQSVSAVSRTFRIPPAPVKGTVSKAIRLGPDDEIEVSQSVNISVQEKIAPPSAELRKVRVYPAPIRKLKIERKVKAIERKVRPVRK